MHQGFAPEATQIALARNLLEQKKQAELQGQRALVVDGRTVEQPVLIQAERLLRRAGLEL